MTTLKYGCIGDEVKELQTALNRAGCTVEVDGVFGSKTTTAVKQIQKKYKLTVDGIVGKQTWSVLQPYMVTWEEFGKAFHTVVDDIEKLPSFIKFVEMMCRD